MTATLSDRKTLAANIAIYIGQFVMTEVFLQGVFERAVRGDGSWADCILHHVQSINTRIDIVEDFLKNCCADRPFAEKAAALMPRLREANSYRNHIAHGLYVEHEGEAAISANMFARKKKHRTEKITASEVLREFRKLEQLHLDFLHVLDAAPLGIPTEFPQR